MLRRAGTALFGTRADAHKEKADEKFIEGALEKDADVRRKNQKTKDLLESLGPYTGSLETSEQHRLRQRALSHNITSTADFLKIEELAERQLADGKKKVNNAVFKRLIGVYNEDPNSDRDERMRRVRNAARLTLPAEAAATDPADDPTVFDDVYARPAEAAAAKPATEAAPDAGAGAHETVAEDEEEVLRQAAPAAGGKRKRRTRRNKKYNKKSKKHHKKRSYKKHHKKHHKKTHKKH
jgi:hypothetical protein